jgi:hypothetical protein
MIPPSVSGTLSTRDYVGCESVPSLNGPVTCQMALYKQQNDVISIRKLLCDKRKLCTQGQIPLKTPHTLLITRYAKQRIDNIIH